MNETLEAIARALFESWFIRFDPVRRNMARKGRGQPSPGASRHPLPVGEGHYRGGYDFSGLVETARDLRARQTPAEDLFWELVRDRQFMGLKFRRQHQLGDYIADFYCHEHRLVIELDGGIHSAKHQKDHKRDAWMEAQEFTVLRFRNEQLIEDPESVLTAIAEIIQAAPTHSLPLGEGRGEGVVAGEAYDHLFPDSFEDSELGEIPTGWELQAFADTIEIVGGGTPKTSIAEYWDGDIPWFSVVDAPTASEVWVVDTEKKVTRAGVENSSTRVLSVGTTIISARGTVGRIALVGVPMAMNQSCYGLRGRAGAHGFFNYFLTRELVARLQQHAHGSVFDTITRDTLAGVSVAMPAAALIEEFEKRVAPSLQRIRAGLLETRTLTALRDTLLPKLISGELRVEDAERFMERAV
jgi:type I restriction enzyme S subunit